MFANCTLFLTVLKTEFAFDIINITFFELRKEVGKDVYKRQMLGQMIGILEGVTSKDEVVSMEIEIGIPKKK